MSVFKRKRKIRIRSHIHLVVKINGNHKRTYTIYADELRGVGELAGAVARGHDRTFTVDIPVVVS